MTQQPCRADGTPLTLAEAKDLRAALLAEGRAVPGLLYRCAWCGAPVWLRPRDVVLCLNCHHKILHKMPAPRVTQYEAR